jgi:hypothetical protein
VVRPSSAFGSFYLFFACDQRHGIGADAIDDLL